MKLWENIAMESEVFYENHNEGIYHYFDGRCDSDSVSLCSHVNLLL